MMSTPCPRCHHIGLVRVEHVIKGPVATDLFTCGRCGHTWTSVSAATPERGWGDHV